ncbi:hypothetical protein [Synechococcus sp. A15-28]|uniref:hypothetical protein n=1 Tax=Synechococcus sp. A15-28 TaxID=1050638 RepID=UPI0016440FAB|nr:hypothetical protein [Synechococcus sp. A15-28]QNI43077.1 hypothetical protein SynA1528_02058 [Synechococcus sp. A15-28]
MSRLVWLLPLALLQACAGSPVAEELQRSFDAPELTVAKTAEKVPDKPVLDQDPADRPQELEGGDTVEEDGVADVAPDVNPIGEPEPMTKSLQPPAPYRITIRLAGADPAAPAEAVTRALRQSDVVFSVERIERIAP